MGRVVVVGSLNADIVLRVEAMPRPGETVLAHSSARYAGGKGANQALAAAAAGAQVTMVGAVGDDDAGAAYGARLARFGIEARLRTVEGHPTGHAYITVDAAHENSIVVAPGANGRLGVGDLDPLDTMEADDILLCQLEVPLDTVASAVRRAAAKGARVVLSCAPFASLPVDVVALADPLICNEHEAGQIADAGMLPASWLVTFGAAGASWDGEQQTAPHVGAQDLRDTTGAGDAFCGALAAALARRADRHTAVGEALAAGAEAVTRMGAQRDPTL